jgi:hypothetical protein
MGARAYRELHAGLPIKPTGIMLSISGASRGDAKNAAGCSKNSDLLFRLLPTRMSGIYESTPVQEPRI